MNIGFLFAGQGAQFLGMGNNLKNKELINRASAICEFDIEQINQDETKINLTEFAQPSIVAVSIAIFEELKAKGIEPNAVAGLSLGEYSAAYASGAIGFNEIIELVTRRGKIMQSAVPAGVGKMAVVLGMDNDSVVKVCKDASNDEFVVEPANFNCNGQVVVGGHISAVDKFTELAKEAGAKRILPLQVSVPSHTSLMKNAAQEFKAELEKVNINETRCNLYTNVTGMKQSSDKIKFNMEMQMYCPTHMGKIIENMLKDGITTFVEVGPGKALSGFVKTVAKEFEKEVTILNAQDQETLDAVIEQLGGK